LELFIKQDFANPCYPSSNLVLNEKNEHPMTCINCNNEHYEKFCPNCGEKSTVSRITFASIFNAALATVTNMDKGFLFNVKNLFLRPNEVVNSYILGKRKNIFNPISYLIITVTIYLIVEAMLKVPVETTKIESAVFDFGYEAGKFMKRYFKYFWILSIIWLSISTKLMFKKYNYAEHLAINSFVIGQATLVGLIAYIPFRFLLVFNPIIYISIIWMTYEIFKSKNRDFDIFFLSVGATFLFFIQLILIVILFGVIRSF